MSGAASSVTTFRRLALLALAVGVLLAASASRAAAADGSLLGCGYAAERPFLRFLDPLPYTLAPDGGFEAGAAGWQLSGGARVVSGNEPFALAGPGTKSLQIPAGGSATSPPMCVGLILPVVRFVATGGALLSTLKVEAVWTDSAGQKRSLELLPFVLGGSRSWLPTLPLLQLGGALNALTLNGLTTDMSFRFTPRAGLFGSGTWKIDDIYVDPWKTI
jgi:ABC-type amino acid transport substrate-binding protein